MSTHLLTFGAGLLAVIALGVFPPILGVGIDMLFWQLADKNYKRYKLTDNYTKCWGIGGAAIGVLGLTYLLGILVIKALQHLFM